MADTVSIPADKARDLAQYHRDRSNAGPHVVSHDAARWHRETADLLDPPPPPPTLHEQVATYLAGRSFPHTLGNYAEAAADAVLAVVAEAFTAFADEHCFRLPEGDLAIRTRAVGEWLRGAS